MTDIISLEESKKQNIEKLEKELAEARKEFRARNKEWGKQQPTREDIARMIDLMKIINDLPKKIAHLRGDFEYKSISDLLEEMMKNMTDAEINSGYLVVRENGCEGNNWDPNYNPLEDDDLDWLLDDDENEE